MKTPGCCSCCGRDCFEVIEFFPPGHPLDGRARRLGPPLECAERVTLLLTDGTTADVTVCADCQDIDLAHLWRECLGAFRFEEDNRQALGVHPNPGVITFLNHVMQQVPVGVLGRRGWPEVLRSENGPAHR